VKGMKHMNMQWSHLHFIRMSAVHIIFKWTFTWQAFCMVDEKHFYVSQCIYETNCCMAQSIKPNNLFSLEKWFGFHLKNKVQVNDA